jgi:hypothetical protein
MWNKSWGRNSLLGVRYNSNPINSQKLLTEPTGPHYTETWKIQIHILILYSIEPLGSLKHVISITLQIRYMRCCSIEYLHSYSRLKYTCVLMLMFGAVVMHMVWWKEMQQCSAIKFYWLDQECTISENNHRRTRSIGKSPRLKTRGVKIGLNEFAPTIPSKKKSMW